jgi:uncharacterized protein YjbJ (UPF0337 family)
MGAIKDKIAGTAKQIEGKLTGDKARMAQGTVQKTVGALEGVASRAATTVKAGARRIEDKVRGATARVDRRARKPV